MTSRRPPSPPSKQPAKSAASSSAGSRASGPKDPEQPLEQGDPEQPEEQGDPELPTEPPPDLPTTPPPGLPTTPPPGLPPQPSAQAATKQQTPTYSLAIMGSSVKTPAAPVVTLDDQYVMSAAAMQAAMARGIMPLCRNPDGSMGYYHFDAEHTRPGSSIVLRKA